MSNLMNIVSSDIGGNVMARHYFRGGRERPPLPPFNSQPAKVFKFKIEKILGSLYLIKPLLEKMDIQAIVDSIVS